MQKLLCPSMMCTDYGDLSGEVKSLAAAGADFLHVDIMDGSFVPNFGMGLQDTEYICRNSPVPVDVHLMIQNPGSYVEQFVALGAKLVYIHSEADVHAPRTLDKILRTGAEAGIALNPGTAFETIRPLLPLVSHVLVMTVNPGFAGQAYLPFVEEKIDALLAHKERYGYKIVIDGACSPQVIRSLNSKGVEGFVLGTSALFGKGRPYREIMAELRKL